MTRKIFIGLFLTLSWFCKDGKAQSATIPNGTAVSLANSIKLFGNPAYVQVSYSPSGGLITEGVALGTNVIAARTSTGALTIQSTQTCPACPPPVAPITNSIWLTGVKASPQPTDSWAGYEEWCVSGASANAVGAFYVGTVVEVQVSSPTLPFAASWTFNEQAMVGNTSAFVSTPTATTPPTFVQKRMECAGGPALMLTPPAIAYSTTPPTPTFTRTAVQIVVVQ